MGLFGCSLRPEKHALYDNLMFNCYGSRRAQSLKRPITTLMKFMADSSDTFPGRSVVVSLTHAVMRKNEPLLEIARCSITEESVSTLSDNLRGQAIIQMNPSQTLQVDLELRFPVA